MEWQYLLEYETGLGYENCFGWVLMITSWFVLDDYEIGNSLNSTIINLISWQLIAKLKH